MFALPKMLMQRSIESFYSDMHYELWVIIYRGLLSKLGPINSGSCRWALSQEIKAIRIHQMTILITTVNCLNSFVNEKWVFDFLMDQFATVLKLCFSLSIEIYYVLFIISKLWFESERTKEHFNFSIVTLYTWLMTTANSF